MSIGISDTSAALHIIAKSVLDGVALRKGLDATVSDDALGRHASLAPAIFSDRWISLAHPGERSMATTASTLSNALSVLPRQALSELVTETPAESLRMLVSHGANDGKDNVTVLRAALDDKLAQISSSAHAFSVTVSNAAERIEKEISVGVDLRSSADVRQAHGGAVPFETDPIFSILMALTALQLLLGQVEREHRSQQQEQQVLRAFAAAEKKVKEAKSQLVGAIGAATLAIGVAGAGLQRVKKGTDIQRHSIQTEGKNADKLANLGTKFDRENAAIHGTAASGADAGGLSLGERTAPRADVNLARLVANEAREEAQLLNTAGRLANLRGGQIQAGGQAIIGANHTIGAISSSGFQVEAASHGRDAAMLEAEANVAAREQEKSSTMVDAHEKQLDAMQALLNNIKAQQDSVADHIARNSA